MSTDLTVWRPSFDEVSAALNTVGGKPLAAPKDLPLLDGEQVQAAIAGRILALDPDAALNGATDGPLSGPDLIGIPIQLTGGEFMPSNVKSGPGFYMLLTFERLDDGSVGMVSTGAHTVMAQMARRLCQDGPWPTPPVIWCQRQEPTPSGGRPEWLEPADSPAA